MKMNLRRITAKDAREAADFLDSQTITLRWLVAFFQHFDELPEEEQSYWSLWRGDAGGGQGLQCIAAHFFQNGTTYVAACPGIDLDPFEALLEEELVPEKLVGDSSTIESWREASTQLAPRVARWRVINVLRSRVTSGLGEPAGFRLASRSDIPVLEEYERLLETELQEEHARDFESLVEHNMVFVVEREGRTQGFVRSNFSDGRFVHAGGLYVHPLYRRKGVGRELASGIAVRVRRTLGVDVILDVYEENTAARHAYESAGYERAGAGLEAQFEDGAWGGS